MITAIEIENLRGIRSGRLDDLRPLTILTGPNGCGKSTVLDALLLAAGASPTHSLAQVVGRRPVTRNGARWLVRKGEEISSISTVDEAGKTYRCGLDVEQFRPDSTDKSSPVHTRIEYLIEDSKGELSRVLVSLAFGADNSYRREKFDELTASEVRIVDSGIAAPLDKTYSDAVRQGRKNQVIDLLKDLVPDLEGLEILTEDDGTPLLYVTTRDGGIPVGFSGDGIQAFVQLALELAATEGGLVLIEEPEAYQHLRSLRQTAKVLLASVRRGVQLVVSTHSLELIDALLGEATAESLENIALFNLFLAQGDLKVSRISGPGIEFARETLEDDLR